MGANKSLGIRRPLGGRGRIVLLCVAVLSTLFSAPFARAGEQHMYANLYAFWQMDDENGFWNVDQYLRVRDKAPYSYWAQYWQWKDAEVGGYLGLQTNGIRFDGSRGDTAIFSLWDANNAIGPACGTFGGEGEGYSCRLKFPIRSHRVYRLRVWRLETDSSGQWWGAWIKNLYTGRDRFVGRIRVATEYNLIAAPTNFSEYFGPAVDCDAVPMSIAYWSAPKANRGNLGYEETSQYWYGHRGECTGGSVTQRNFMGTKGARIIQGGPR